MVPCPSSTLLSHRFLGPKYNITRTGQKNEVMTFKKSQKLNYLMLFMYPIQNERDSPSRLYYTQTTNFRPMNHVQGVHSILKFSPELYQRLCRNWKKSGFLCWHLYAVLKHLARVYFLQSRQHQLLYYFFGKSSHQPFIFLTLKYTLFNISYTAYLKHNFYIQKERLSASAAKSSSKHQWRHHLTACTCADHII